MNDIKRKLLTKIQAVYNIIIVRDETEERVFVVESYTSAQNLIPLTTIKGREITDLISSGGLVSHMGSNSETTLDERKLIFTKMAEIPVVTYKFSHHYRYEIWETD